MNIKAFVSLALLIVPTTTWADTVLSITNGQDEVVQTFSIEQLDALEQTSYETVNAFIDEPSTFSGPLVRTVMADAGVEVIEGRSFEMIAVNDYAVAIPAEDILEYDVILATRRDGKVLSVREKGPVWVMYPISKHDELKDSIYSSRLIWQLSIVKAME